MKKLATFIIKSITGSDDFTVKEKVDERIVELEVKSDPQITGLIIGKGGQTIKTIRKILSIKATLENKVLNISVTTK